MAMLPATGLVTGINRQTAIARWSRQPHLPLGPSACHLRAILSGHEGSSAVANGSLVGRPIWCLTCWNNP